MSLRIDRAPIKKYEKLSDGRLRVMATFSRVGPLDYLRADGTTQTEWITAEELFKEDSLDSAALAPVTLGHPSAGLITPQNWKEYAVGASGSKITVRQDEGLVDIVYVINDQEAIDAVQQGDTKEVSMGYQTVVEQREDGKFYQTKRRYNHHALVPKGRAGSTVRLHLDSDEDFAVQVNTDDKGVPDMPKIKGVDVPQLVYDEYMSVKEDRDSLKSKLSQIKSDAADLTKVTAERDMLQAKVDSQAEDLKTKLDADQITAAAQARLDAFDQAKPFLPKETKFDAKVEPTQWMRKAIAAANPKLNLDEKSDEYIQAAFDTLCALGTSEQQRQKRIENQKNVLDAAAAGGDHNGGSLERSDNAEYTDAQIKADGAEINQLYSQPQETNQ